MRLLSVPAIAVLGLLAISAQHSARAAIAPEPVSMPQAMTAGNLVQPADYYWRGARYPYRWRGGYYNYTWHGGYYRHRRWRNGLWRYY